MNGSLSCMIAPRFVIGFSGHRRDYDEPSVRASLRLVLADLQARAAGAGGTADIYSGPAEGSDTLFIELAQELGIAVHLLLPLAVDEFEKDFASPAAWARSASLIQDARQELGKGLLHIVEGETSRPECYFNHAVTMLDAADVLVTVWDGHDARGPGGTAQVMSLAEKMGRPVIIVDATTGTVSTRGNLEAVFAADEIIADLNSMARMDDPASDTPVETAAQLQDKLNELAMSDASRVRPSLVRIILLNGAATLLAATITFNFPPEYAADHWWTKSKWMVACAELVLVVTALWMTYSLQKKHARHRWTRCRFACEEVRALRSSVPLVNPLHPIIDQHDPAWRRFSLSAGLLVLKEQCTADMISLRDQYLDVRLSETDPHGQIRHYQMMRPRANWWWNFTGVVGRCSAALAPVFVLLSLLNKLSTHFPGGHAWHLDQNPYTWAPAVFLPIALPLTAGVAASLRHALDAGRRNQRYPQMETRLKEARDTLPSLQTPSTIRKAVSQMENLLLHERMEWRLAMQSTGR